MGVVQALSLAVAVVGAILILVTRGAAQAPVAPRGAAQPSAGREAAMPAAPLDARGARADAGPSDAGRAQGGGGDAGASDGGASPGPSPDAKPAGDGGPIDYAEVQTDSDFPAGMSEEEKAAIGTGKVPIHREGKFRSPFAHPRFGKAAVAKVGLVLIRVGDYNIQTGTCEADFFLSLTADRELPDLALDYANGKEVQQTTLADTPTFKLYRVRGKFTTPTDLRRYPFDKQDVAIELEDQKAGVDQLVFIPDQNRTSLDEGFDISGWSVGGLGARSYRHQYTPRFDRDDLYVSRYRFVLLIERFGLSAAFSVFVPAFVIVIIAMSGMWVPPEELEVRSNTGAPMLAAAVLFHYSLTQALPATGYLTRADMLMLGVYISLLLNMGSTWLFLVVSEARLQWTFNVCRWVVPIAMAVVTVVSSIL